MKKLTLTILVIIFMVVGCGTTPVTKFYEGNGFKAWIPAKSTLTELSDSVAIEHEAGTIFVFYEYVGESINGAEIFVDNKVAERVDEVEDGVLCSYIVFRDYDFAITCESTGGKTLEAFLANFKVLDE